MKWETRVCISTVVVLVVLGFVTESECGHSRRYRRRHRHHHLPTTTEENSDDGEVPTTTEDQFVAAYKTNQTGSEDSDDSTPNNLQARLATLEQYVRYLCLEDEEDVDRGIQHLGIKYSSCSHYVSAGIDCPSHPLFNDPAQSYLPSSGSSSCVVDGKVLQSNIDGFKNAKEFTLKHASLVIECILNEIKANNDIHGDLKNPYVYYKVISKVVERVPPRYTSSHMRFTVLFQPAFRKIATEGKIYSLLYANDTSTISFYGCSEPGCFNVGSELKLKKYCCHEHVTKQCLQIEAMYTRNWALVGITMLLEVLCSNRQEGTPFKATERNWFYMLDKLNRLGVNGILIPFSNAVMRIFIGPDRKTLNYQLKTKPAPRRMCVSPFCMAVHSHSISTPFCVACADTRDFDTFSRVLDPANYGIEVADRVYKGTNETWLSDLS